MRLCSTECYIAQVQNHFTAHEILRGTGQGQACAGGALGAKEDCSGPRASGAGRNSNIGIDLLQLLTYIVRMSWTVFFQEDFADEFATLDEEVRVEMRAMVGHLAKFGPAAKRPHVDTLKGAKIANLKEFRFSAANGVW